MDKSSGDLKFAICIQSEGCDDLQLRKLYRLLPDGKATEHDYIRIVDDSGEDYLYPADRFVVFEFPEQIARQLISAEPSAV